MFSIYSIRYNHPCLLFTSVRDMDALMSHELPLIHNTDFQSKPKHIPTGIHQTSNDSEMKIY